MSDEYRGKHCYLTLSDSHGVWSLDHLNGGKRSGKYLSGDNTKMGKLLLDDDDYRKNKDCSRANAWSLIKGDMEHSTQGIPDVLYIGRSGQKPPEIRTCHAHDDKERKGEFIRFATDEEIKKYVPK